MQEIGYIVTAYRSNRSGDLLPTVRGTAPDHRQALRLAGQVLRMSMPGTVFRYPLVTVACVDGPCTDAWRVGSDYRHHRIDPEAITDRLPETQ